MNISCNRKQRRAFKREKEDCSRPSPTTDKPLFVLRVSSLFSFSGALLHAHMFNDHPRSRDHRPLNAHPHAFEQLQKRLRECKQANVDLAREISKVGVRIFLLVLNRISHVRTIYDVYFESLPFSLSHSHRYEANRKTLEISRTARLCPNP